MTDFVEKPASLRDYGADCQPSEIRFLAAAGGFSGAAFWQLQTPRGQLCLRLWPVEHPKRERLEQMHQLLRHVAGECDVPLPLPIETNEGRSYTERDGRLWQLEPWMPGEANFQAQPTDERLTAAMVALAKFHNAAASFPSPEVRTAVSPGIAARLEKLQSWTDQRMTELLQQIQSRRRDELLPVYKHVRDIVTNFRAAAPAVQKYLKASASSELTLIPCIRDIHDGHVLFQGCEVSGLIDFGSFNFDHPTCDVARLLGSLVGDDVRLRQEGLAAYEELRPLVLSDRALVRVWDQSTTLLSGMNWLEWIFLDRRQFESYHAVGERLARISQRLSYLARG